jgi:ubiquinone/menaquinone biosynthesis C-methylase UbiE
MNRKKASSKSRHGRREGHRFSAEDDFIVRLEGSERREIIPVERILPDMGLGNEDVVADLGSGIGYFSLPIAEHVREVVSIDLEPKMLRVLSKRVREGNLRNVSLVRGEITGLPIADSSMDHVLAAFVYHEVPSQEGLIRECARILREGGSLTVIDFQKRSTSFGPPVKERKKPEHVLRTSREWFRLASRHETEVYYQLLLTRI